MSTDRQTIAAMRFGTGFRPGLVPPGDADGLLAELRAGARAPLVFPVEGLPERAARLRAFRAARRADRGSDEVKRLRTEARAAFKRDAVTRILQRAFAPDGFFERMAAFWADHFTVSARGFVLILLAPAHETEAIRPNLAKRFADLLRAAVLHPAMLVYLDQHNSVGENSPFGLGTGNGPNENLAREVLELHTLGVGGPYTQGDVREFADLLTGYSIDVRDGTTWFRPRRAEPGAETVLGRSYGGDAPDRGDAVAFLDDLAVHPATAAHVSRKLAVHFIADQPPAGLVAAMEAAWRRTRGDLREVYRAMLTHPAAWADAGAKIRPPQEMVAAALRATGAEASELDPDERKLQAGIIGGLSRMNQPVFRPPGPDGWPEAAEAWITPQGLAARLDWSGRIGRVFADRGLDPREYAEAALGPAMRAETRFLVAAAAEKWEGVTLALASPEFNRR